MDSSEEDELEELEDTGEDSESDGPAVARRPSHTSTSTRAARSALSGGAASGRSGAAARGVSSGGVQKTTPRGGGGGGGATARSSGRSAPPRAAALHAAAALRAAEASLDSLEDEAEGTTGAAPAPASARQPSPAASGRPAPFAPSTLAEMLTVMASGGSVARAELDALLAAPGSDAAAELAVRSAFGVWGSRGSDASVSAALTGLGER